MRQLLGFIDWLMGLPPALQERFEDEIQRYEEEKHMPYVTSFERSGIRKGLLKGIEVSLELRFGPEGVQLMPEIRELHDHEVLEAVLEAIKTAASPDELRKVWVPERRPKKGRRT